MKKIVDNSMDVITAMVDLFLQKENLPPIATLATKSSQTIYHAVALIKERNFNNRLKAFLLCTGQTTDKDRIEFLKRLGDNKKDFFEKTLLIIESFDDEFKAELLGKLCTSLILERINMDMFWRLATLIETNLSIDLALLRERQKKHYPDLDVQKAREFFERSHGVDAFDLRYKGLSHNTTGGPSPLAVLLLEYGF